MIETDKTFEATNIYCDGCDAEDQFDGVDFYKAIDDAKELGWKIIKKDGEWCHYCVLCKDKQ